VLVTLMSLEVVPLLAVRALVVVLLVLVLVLLLLLLLLVLASALVVLQW
jgi:hypothetical protein